MKNSKVSFLLDEKSKVYIDDLAILHKKQNCLKLILQARGGKMICEKCGNEMKPLSGNSKKHNKNQIYYCSKCRCQKSLLSGTIFHHTKVPLHKWFYALYEMTRNTNGISHLNLCEKIGVNVKTAKRMMMKIRERLIENVIPDKQEMTGIVEVDETYMASKKLPGGM